MIAGMKGPVVVIGSSFVTTALSECGDRTFIASAILAMKYNHHVVFWATFSALAVQSLTSSIFGEILRRLFDGCDSQGFPWTKLFSIFLFAFFAVNYLLEGFKGIRSLKGDVSSVIMAQERLRMLVSEDSIGDDDSSELENMTSALRTPLTDGSRMSLWPLFWEIFTIIYVTEVGDSSMAAQVALASYSSFVCVFAGACLANALVNGAGIYCGSYFAGKINIQFINICAGFLFSSFVILNTYEIFNLLSR